MTATAPKAARREWGANSLLARGLIAGIGLCGACPATAEVGAAVSVFSDARFRGYSLSSGHPVGVADLSYDDPSGLYGALSGSVVASSGIEPLSLQASGGYAKRLTSGVTIDVGAVHSRYSHYSSRGASNSYTEIYAGLSRGIVTSRLYFSPHYFGRGSRALYGEIDAGFAPVRRVRLDGHVGLLLPLDYRSPTSGNRAQYDWRVAAAREVGRASLRVIATGGGPGHDYYGNRPHNRTALIVGVSWAL